MSFVKRTTKPEAGNKYYNTAAKGGWSTCIVGSPVDSNCNVLSNCVGYACGRFNEIIGSMKYPSLNCNAESFLVRAKATYPDLTYGSTPKVGAIAVWSKGTIGNSSDGVGHVAIVEKVIDSNTILTSESSYGGSAFFTKTRTNTDKAWGSSSSSYAFVTFIYNPAVTTASALKTTAEIAAEVIAGKWGNGAERKNKLEAAGYDYATIQAKVNELTSASKSNTTIAYEVIAGKWGNGTERKNKLEAAGYHYATIQSLVNNLLK